MLRESVKILGEPPGTFGLLLLGSSSRQERLSFSDIELALLYNADPQNVLQMRIYLYVMMSIFEFLVLQLRESGPRYSGFCIDPSENLVIIPNTLDGTVDEIYQQHIERPWVTSPGFLVLHEDLEGQAVIFTSLLSPILVNKNMWGGSSLFLEYSAKLHKFLDSESDKWTQEALKSAFNHEKMVVDLSRKPNIGYSAKNSESLLNRHLIALYTLMGVYQDVIARDVGSETFSVRFLYHRPLAFLAITLRLFFDTRAVCAIDVFGEASTRGILPFAVARLLQEMYFFSVSWQIKVHFQHGYREEELNLLKFLGKTDGHS
jgi:hypothetical protein